jgi:hypothetical protein
MVTAGSLRRLLVGIHGCGMRGPPSACRQSAVHTASGRAGLHATRSAVWSAIDLANLGPWRSPSHSVPSMNRRPKTMAVLSYSTLYGPTRAVYSSSRYGRSKKSLPPEVEGEKTTRPAGSPVLPWAPGWGNPVRGVAVANFQGCFTRTWRVVTGGPLPRVCHPRPSHSARGRGSRGRPRSQHQRTMSRGRSGSASRTKTREPPPWTDF